MNAANQQTDSFRACLHPALSQGKLDVFVYVHVVLADAKLSTSQGQTATQIVGFILYSRYPPLSVFLSCFIHFCPLTLLTISPWLWVFFWSSFSLSIFTSESLLLTPFCVSVVLFVLSAKRPEMSRGKMRESEKGRRGGRGRYLHLFSFCVLCFKQEIWMCACVAAVLVPLHHWRPVFALQAGKAHGRAELSHAIKAWFVRFPFSLSICV